MGVSGYYPVSGYYGSGIRSSFSPDRYPVDYYPVSGKTVSGTSLNHIPIQETKKSVYILIYIYSELFSSTCTTISIRGICLIFAYYINLFIIVINFAY